MYKGNLYQTDSFCRWNFTDFFHAFMLMFRVICGEWIEPLWDCMRIRANKNIACIFVFIPMLILGNFIVRPFLSYQVFNLFDTTFAKINRGNLSIYRNFSTITISISYSIDYSY